ncbi:hypothetical protein [Nocardia callitridis]|uniref:Ig-like domain repeat protein n=1 Tax=Nocardia callitridis TaxID=648753 RepID=A0ABP9L570_9NOCA
MRKITTARVGAAVAVFATATAVLSVAMPTASATVTKVGALPGMHYGVGTNYGTGCEYTVVARVTDPVEPVAFYDNGIPLPVVRPSGGEALLQWVPATPGPHTLSAVQGSEQTPLASVDLRVGTGSHVAHACVVFGG